MIIQRDLIGKLKPFIKRREYIAIEGPRQCGKTTFLEILRNYLIKNMDVNNTQIQILTFEDRRLLTQFNSDPVMFVCSYMKSQENKKFFLMLDEFQYSQEGGQKLKLVYDTVKNLKIIITGSSSLDLKSQISKYMVGRMLTFHIYPFSFGEYLRARDARIEDIYQRGNKVVTGWIFGRMISGIRKGNDIFFNEIIKLYEKYCIWGGYPAVILSKTDEQRYKVLNDIYSSYILKDIKGLLELATENNLFLLSKYLAVQTGNIVNYKNLSEASDLIYRNMKKHINILRETFICTEINPFFRNRQKELSKNPKIFFYDLGFRNNIIENMNNLDKRPDSGNIVENTVFIRLNEVSRGLNKINFWRTKSGAEVDFIFHHAGKIIPIEVKFNKFINTKASRSFMSFIEKFKPQRGVVLTKDFWGKTKKNNTEILFAPVYYL